MKRDNKIHVAVIVVGHVDSGKSTTTGHLVYRCGGVDKRTIEKFEKESTGIGRKSFHYAWVLDRTKEERDRGITIDCTTVVVPTQNVFATFIDAPGHRDFIKNMITGASQADYALFMVPAGQGEFETAISALGQFRQQVALAKTMGINHGLVVVNKMDTADYKQDRYNEIVAEVRDRLKKIGYKPGCVAYMPASGLVGDNIMDLSTNMPWYTAWEYNYVNPDKSEVKITGKTLYDFINSLKEPPRAIDKDLRGTLTDSYKISGVGTVAVGRVDSGIMKVGDIVHISPAGITSEVKSIEMHHESKTEGKPGDNIGFNLKNVAVKDIKRGSVFGKQANNPPKECERFTGQVIVIDKIGDGYALHAGMAPLMDIHTAHIPIRVEQVVEIIEKKGKKKVVVEEAPVDSQNLVLKKEQTGIVNFVPVKPVSLETFKEYPGLGRFSIRDSRVTVAVGVVMSVQTKEDKGKQSVASGGAKTGKAPKAAAKSKK